jgi:hypothetical protein
MYSKVLYHGTSNKARLLKEGFREDMMLSGRGVMAFGIGFYACPTFAQAHRYGDVVKVQVTLQDPYDGDFKRFRNYVMFGNTVEITRILRSEGHDGIILKGIKDEVCVFDAENIKVIG